MRIVKISTQKPDLKIIKEAARVIKSGGLVIFPTETVYGLGADAFNAVAVRNIFKAKGRPEKKPLIVHVSKKSTIDVLVHDVPSVVHKLMAKFWPGPLTLVLRARAGLPKRVSGTSMLSIMKVDLRRVPTVAIRMPAHKVALALIRAAGPLAAPSANFSGEKPPTRISEIPQALLKKVDLVLDAGPTPVKVPSTVLDLTSKKPFILRKGRITKTQIAQVMSNV